MHTVSCVVVVCVCVYVVCVQDLLDVNSLELARQLTLTFSSLLRDIRVSHTHTLIHTNTH